MSIIDFIHLSQQILAIDSNGYLLSWDISCLQNQNKQSSFLRNKLQLHITSSLPISLVQTPTHICVCAKDQIVMIEAENIENLFAIQKGINRKDDKKMKIVKYEQTESGEQIKCMTKISNEVYGKEDIMMNEGEEENEADTNQFSIVYATKSGKIYKICEKLNTPVLLCDIFAQSQDLAPAKQQKITSIVSFRSDSHLLVGTTLGRVLIFNLNLNKIVGDIVTNCQLSLQPVNHIYLEKGQHKFFTLHHSYVVEWSLELQKPLGYYTYPTAYDVLTVDQLIDQKPSLLICGGNRIVQVQNNDGMRNQIQTSLLSVRKALQINGKLLFGGSNGMIQVFKGGISQMLLFRE